MANRKIITTYARCSYPHLDKPHAHDDKQEPKYSITLMFPKTEVTPSHIGNFESSPAIIMQALEEVCMEQWGCSFEQVQSHAGVKFPPEWKDGDQNFKKNEQGIITNEVHESTQGMWMISIKNMDPVGVCDHTGANPLPPEAIYGGCWVRAQIEASAYKNGSNQNICSLKLINVQKCFDDESFGAGPAEAATTAFAGMAVEGSNCVTGADQSFTQPGTPARPGGPAGGGALKMLPAAEFTMQQYLDAGWTEQDMIDNGVAEREAPKAPTKPSGPGKPAGPGKPSGPSAPAKPAEPEFVLNNTAEFTLQEYLDAGWTHDDLIAHGHGDWTKPAPKAPTKPSGPGKPAGPGNSPYLKPGGGPSKPTMPGR